MNESLKDDLLRGARRIARELYPADESEKALRRVYNEQHRWPIWSEDGVLFALRSRLRAHAEAKSAQREAEIAAAEIGGRQPQFKASSKSRRRRAARKAAA